MANIRIGISGWTFEGWRGNFYPKGLVQREELAYASRQLNSIEINGTFYALQKPATFEKWYEQTPENFCFSVKAPRYITHIKRLKEVDEAVANFFASGLLCLKDKLGPILWQFPPNVMLKDNRFEEFFKLLPKDMKSAGRLAKKHSPKLKDRNYTHADGNEPVRHAFEFRHPSFQNEEFIKLMRAHGIAVVFAHSGLKSPYIEELTADFVFARMHGQESQFKKGYTPAVLKDWAGRVAQWSTKRDVFIYFDTEAKKYAPQDALKLARLTAPEGLVRSKELRRA